MTTFENWKAMRQEIKAEARRVIDENPNDALWRIMGRVETATAGWNVNGYVRSRLECTLAVKALVLIGRCRNHGHERVAYWMPKKAGPLRDARCARCGRPLDQTTLSFNARFDPLFPQADLRAADEVQGYEDALQGRPRAIGGTRSGYRAGYDKGLTARLSKVQS